MISSTSSYPASFTNANLDIEAGEHFFFESLLDFLKSKPNSSFYQLHAIAYRNHTELRYDTDNKYYQNEDHLLSLPRVNYRGAAAESLWNLLNKLGIVRYDYGRQYAPQKSSPTAQLKWAAAYRYQRKQEPQGRWAELSIAQEQQLYNYLSIACNTVAASIPTTDQYLLTLEAVDSHKHCYYQTEECTEPRQLYDFATQLASDINETYEAELKNLVTFLQAAPENNVCTRVELLDRISAYTFSDGVVVSSVKEKHFHPIQFIGVQIQIANDSNTPPLLKPIFQDNRESSLHRNSNLSEHLTKEYYLAHGVRGLHLNSSYLEWVLQFGEPDPTNHRLLEIEAKHLLLAKPSQLDMVEADDLPF